MKPLLSEGDLSEFERQLLRSGHDDVPSDAIRNQTLAALGLASASVIGASAVAHAALQTGAVPAGAAATKASSSLTAMLVAKWVATGAFVGAVAAGGVAVVATRTTTPAVTSAVATSRVVSAPTRQIQKTSRAGLAAAPVAEPAPEDAAEGLAAAPRAVVTLPGETPRALAVEGVPPPPAVGRSVAGWDDPSGAAPASSTRVTQEVASLDRARAALRDGDASGALSRLAQHSQAFPGGALEPEAVVLRVQALVQLGRRAEAERTARQFLAAHPSSPQAARLGALVRQPGER